MEIHQYIVTQLDMVRCHKDYHAAKELIKTNNVIAAFFKQW